MMGGKCKQASRIGSRPRRTPEGFRRCRAGGALAAAILLLSAATSAFAGHGPFLPAQGSTIPGNGDVNPYGLALVPQIPAGGTIHRGELLVSNFNDSANVQGNGKTIIIVDPSTAQQANLFFQATTDVGFTNALAVLRAGFVLAGSVTSTPSSGGLLVLDRNGTLKETITAGVNGAWGLAINEQDHMAQLFVSNVFDGTITRLEVSLKGGDFSVVGAPITIASGYMFGLDSAGLVIGPAGLVYNRGTNTLYVAAEGDNAIFAVHGAGTLQSSGGMGDKIFTSNHLHGPLGLMLAPNGDFVTANADPAAFVDPAEPSELVEFTPEGKFVREFSIDPNNGSAFAILDFGQGRNNHFAYVDDSTSTLSILNLSPF